MPEFQDGQLGKLLTMLLSHASDFMDDKYFRTQHLHPRRKHLHCTFSLRYIFPAGIPSKYELLLTSGQMNVSMIDPPVTPPSGETIAEVIGLHDFCTTPLLYFG